MDLKKPRRLLLFLGAIVIIAIAALFIFGWRDINLTCRRPSPGAPPTCQVSESFMGLYTRQVTAEQATGVSFQIRQSPSPVRPGTDSGPTTTGTVVLATPSGEASISRGSSSGDGKAKAELIGKMQEFLDKPDSLEFHHQVRIPSLF